VDLAAAAEQEQQRRRRGRAWRVAAGANELLAASGEGFAEEGVGGVGEHGVGEAVEGV